ncbi:MAG: hypothetical protein HWN65_09885 [Candidatus Helarchaeota archaeon]|nr:hypothetical protein [Candidatus Helarchaeota archaeon]
MEATKRRKFSFEEIFGNEKHVKILVILSSKRRTRSRSKAAKLRQAESFGYLKKRTNVSKETLKNYLHVLVTSGFIQEIESEGETLYRFFFESAKGKALKKLFRLFHLRDD